MFASPATAAFRMLSGDEPSLVAAVWVLAWVAGLFAVAAHIGFDVRPVRPAAVSRSRAQRRRAPISGAQRPRAWAAVRPFVHVDRRSLLGDRFLVMLAVSLPLLALLASWFSGSGVVLVHARTGIDVTADLPAIWAFVLVIHVPVMVGTLAGLLWAEDRDAGLLPVIATTPAGLPTLVGYRLAGAAAGAAVAVAVVLPIAGVMPAAGTPGLAATAAAGGVIATVPTALIGALAHDRVQAVAAMKAMTVPLYLPAAWWFIDTPMAWLVAVIPTAWTARAFWAASPAVAGLYALGAAAVTAAYLALLTPRMQRTKGS